MTSFLLGAGGTGGHMYPALTLAQKLQEEGHQVHIITDKRGAQYLPKGTSYTAINLSTLGRRTWWKMPMILWQMMVLCVFCLQYLVRYNPQKIIGFGGYVSYPILLLAKLLGKPYYLHEQNSVMGRVNRWFADGSASLLTSFPETTPAHTKAVFAGLPVRQELHMLRNISYIKPTTSLCLLVIGGSQGASIFSKVVPEALALLAKTTKTKIHVVQQCRADEIQGVEEAYKSCGVTCHIAPFIENMAAELKQCHLVISRAGASTIAELSLVGRPAILVPYKKAMDDHQTSNGRYISNQQGGWLMDEETFQAEALAALLGGLIEKPELLLNASNAIKILGQPDATNQIFQRVTQ